MTKLTLKAIDGAQIQGSNIVYSDENISSKVGSAETLQLLNNAITEASIEIVGLTFGLVNPLD